MGGRIPPPLLIIRIYATSYQYNVYPYWPGVWIDDLTVHSLTRARHVRICLLYYFKDFVKFYFEKNYQLPSRPIVLAAGPLNYNFVGEISQISRPLTLEGNKLVFYNN